MGQSFLGGGEGARSGEIVQGSLSWLECGVHQISDGSYLKAVNFIICQLHKFKALGGTEEILGGECKGGDSGI